MQVKSILKASRTALASQDYEEKEEDEDEAISNLRKDLQILTLIASLSPKAKQLVRMKYVHSVMYAWRLVWCHEMRPLCLQIMRWKAGSLMPLGCQ